MSWTDEQASEAMYHAALGKLQWTWEIELANLLRDKINLDDFVEVIRIANTAIKDAEDRVWNDLVKRRGP